MIGPKQGVAMLWLALLGSVSAATARLHAQPAPPDMPVNNNTDPIHDAFITGDAPFQWSSLTKCRNTPISNGESRAELRFEDGRSLRIEQKTVGRGWQQGQSVGIYGSVRVQPTPDDSGVAGGSIVVETIANDERLKAEVKVWNSDYGMQNVRITTPRDAEWWTALERAPCIYLRVTVNVPRGGKASLDYLNLDTTQLSAVFVSGLALNVKEQAVIKTVSGSVWSPRAADVDNDAAPYALSSPWINIKTVSGYISGRFTLDDALRVDTVSGSIGLQVVPRLADASRPTTKPASLAVTSTSGNIFVDEPLRPPPSDHTIRIVSISGNILANVVMTSAAELKSTSGNVNARVVPATLSHISEAYRLLTTQSNSGASVVRVVSPSENIAAPLPEFEARHSSMSGKVNLFYPASWAGRFRFDTYTGSKSVVGQGVQIVEENKRTLLGTRLSGSSFVGVRTFSGNINMQVGD